MIRRTLQIALVLGMSAGATAQVTAPPAGPAAPTGVELPAGHPAIPADNNASNLPPGHPQIGQPADAPGNLPPGHPQIDQPADAPGNLPPGHPDLPGAGKQSVAHGSLTLTAVQGTAGGTNPAGDPVSIDFYSADPSPQHFEGKLDANGVLNIPDITIRSACQPLIKLNHAGVDYQGIGQVLDTVNTGQKVQVKVFDTTEVQPQWSIKMRHLIVRRTPEGLSVTDMLMVDTPGDRVWRGIADAQGHHVTLDLPLSPGAQNVQFGEGMKDGSASVKDGHLISGAPLLPGTTQYQFTYTLPVQDGKAEIAVAAPVAVGHMMMFAPDDNSTVTGDGLIAAGSGNAAGGTMRFYMVASIAAGKVLKIDFAHLAPPPVAKAAGDDASEATVATTPANTPATPPSAPAPDAAPSHSSTPLIVGIGSGVLLVGGAIAIFTRPVAHRH